MPEEGPNNPCFVCGGTGLKEGQFCTPCLGTGTATSAGLRTFLKDLSDKVDDVMNKCKDIKEVVDGL